MINPFDGAKMPAYLFRRKPLNIRLEANLLGRLK
jgi:hypothetical protein